MRQVNTKPLIILLEAVMLIERRDLLPEKAKLIITLSSPIYPSWSILLPLLFLIVAAIYSASRCCEGTLT
jgi:p-aminobenzoyl-glutamate transporter AbgT